MSTPTNPTVTRLPLNAREAKLLHDAHAAYQRAERDYTVVFTALLAARDIGAATLLQLWPDAVEVAVAEGV